MLRILAAGVQNFHQFPRHRNVAVGGFGLERVLTGRGVRKVDVALDMQNTLAIRTQV